MNWYAALILIVLVGIASVFLARHDYDKKALSVPPAVGQTWHAALSFDVCGKVQAALPATASGSSSGLTSSGSGVLLIAPKTSSEAGRNATLGKFAKGDTGMVVSNTTLQYPGGTQYTNGAKCKSGTPDAGQTGVVRVRSWTLSSSGSQKSGSQVKLLGGHTSSKPGSLRFRNGQLITVSFGPASKTVPKVPGTTELALLQAINGTQAPATTTTTAPTTTTTTAPTTSSTTASTSSTTASSTTTNTTKSG